MNTIKKTPSNKSKFWLRLGGVGLVTLLALMVALLSLPVPSANAQQPTGSIPTVTGTPQGPFVTVYTDQDQIGVYAGPDSEAYAKIGILVSGQSVPAIGRSVDEMWIEIIYLGTPSGKGWIFASFVSLNNGDVPVVNSPSTATPRTTPTIDPTYAAAFGLQVGVTQQPTFTQPAALNIPTFSPGTSTASKLPFGLIIVGLIFVGVLGGIVSFVRGSR